MPPIACESVMNLCSMHVNNIESCMNFVNIGTIVGFTVWYLIAASML